LLEFEVLESEENDNAVKKKIKIKGGNVINLTSNFAHLSFGEEVASGIANTIKAKI
jgi:hypothetical protein